MDELLLCWPCQPRAFPCARDTGRSSQEEHAASDKPVSRARATGSGRAKSRDIPRSNKGRSKDQGANHSRSATFSGRSRSVRGLRPGRGKDKVWGWPSSRKITQLPDRPAVCERARGGLIEHRPERALRRLHLLRSLAGEDSIKPRSNRGGEVGSEAEE